MMDENVVPPDLRKQLVGVGRRGEPRLHNRKTRLVLEVGPIEADELLELGEIEQALDQVDLIPARVQPSLESLEHPARDRAGDLDANDVAEAPAPQLILNRFEEV